MKLWFKKLTTPETNDTKEITVVQLWYVKWFSRDGPYSSDLNKEVEVFTSAEEANAFAESLVAAFKLLKYTSGTQVTVIKN